MTRTVLVTGATGFIGRHLVRHLARESWRVIALARQAAKHRWPEGVEPRELPDLNRPVDWSPLVAGASHIVHLAGLAHASSELPEQRYQAINVDATAAMAKAAREASIARVVLLSSVRAQSGPVAHSTLRAPDSPYPTDAYGRSKLAAERSVASALSGSGTEWVTLRPVLVYGPGVKGNMGTLVELARLPLPLPLARLTGRRSLLSVDNLTTAISHALVAPSCAREVFLVSDANPVTVPEIIAALRSGLGRSPGLFAVPPAALALLARLTGLREAWDRLAGDLVADSSKLAATGWRPPLSTYEALAAAARNEASPAQRL
jgi:UDP-glucose 4-epimerase